MAQVVKIQVNGQLQWQVHQTPSGHWLGQCPALGLSMEEPTVDGLIASINDAVQLVMSDLLEAGELDEFLRARGWSSANIGVHQDGGVEFDVPIELLVQAGHGQARRVLQ